MDAVLAHGQFILGPEVEELERRLAAFAGVGHAIAVSSGRDALMIALMAMGVKPGDAVFVPAFTFAATAGAVASVGAAPVFVDVDPATFNMDPADLERAIAETMAAGRRAPRVVMPVDLYGLPADYAAIGKIAARHGLDVLADAAQSFGGARRQPPRRRAGADQRHQLLSDQAARLLRRRRRDPRRGRGARRARAHDPLARPRRHRRRGDGARPHRPARHAAGGDPARQARGVRRGARPPPRDRRPLQRGARRCGHRAGDPGRLRAARSRSTPSASPTATRSRARLDAQGHRHRPLLSPGAPPASGVPGLRRARRCRSPSALPTRC